MSKAKRKAQNGGGSRLKATAAMRAAETANIPASVLGGAGEGLEDPTPERAARDLIVSEETVAAGRRRKRVATQRVLDRCHVRRLITDEQYSAGNRLWRTFHSAGGAVRVTATWGVRVDGAGGGGATQHVAAMEEIRHALRDVGSQLSPVLVAVCIENVTAGEWAKSEYEPIDSGMVLFRRALNALIEHYAKTAARRGVAKNA